MDGFGSAMQSWPIPAPDPPGDGLTPEEAAFVLQIMKQLTLNPTDPSAAKTVAVVQSIIKKLGAK